MADWGAIIAALVGLSGVIGFILRLLYAALTKSIEQNRQDRLHAIAQIWLKVDKIHDELHREYVRREEMREMEQRMVAHIVSEIQLAIAKLVNHINSSKAQTRYDDAQDDGK